MTIRLSALICCAAGLLAAQPPEVGWLVSSASFEEGYLAQGALMTVLGRNLARETRAAASIPYPEELGGTRVALCNQICQPMRLLYVSPEQVNFLIDVETVYNGLAARLEVTTAQGSVDLPTYHWTEAQPEIFLVGYDCDADAPCGFSPAPDASKPVIRAAVTDLNYGLVTSENPAELGGYYTLWVTGLGEFHPLTGALSGGREARVLIFGSRPEGIRFDYRGGVDAVYAGATLEYPGLYQINFRMPQLARQDWPDCTAGPAEVWITVRVSLRDSNYVPVPVRTVCE